MKAYLKYKKKWLKTDAEGNRPTPFDLSLFRRDSFCMRYSDAGGGGSCFMSVTTTGFFRNAHEALGYLRVADIPFFLAFMSGEQTETLEDAEIFLPRVELAVSRNTRKLLGMMDAALDSKIITRQQLSAIQAQFNRTFRKTNPEVRICSWGTIEEVLQDKAFWSSVPMEFLEDEEDYPDTCSMRTLIMNKSFDVGNRSHLRIVKGCMEEVELY